MIKEGSRTPWGKADYARPVANGIYQVGTPSHGGYKLDRYTNSCVHAAWRRKGGWYEEDCEWAIVAVTFQQTAGFSCEVVEQAHATLKNYFPEEYKAVYGIEVDPSESWKLRALADGSYYGRAGV